MGLAETTKRREMREKGQRTQEVRFRNKLVGFFRGSNVTNEERRRDPYNISNSRL